MREAPAALVGRLVSLDAFRGLTMASMVIVNNPGDWAHMYGPLRHAEWFGWTPTDLIFPFFLFIVGVSITLTRRSVGVRTILSRTTKLVGLGLLLAGYPRFDPAVWRIPGVLQRIGLCYLASALIYRSASHGGKTSDARVVRVVAVAALVALAGYWVVLLAVPGASGVRFDLTPEGNVGAVVDRAVFGTHLWKKTWDPEGLLSSIPAIGSTLLGVLAGVWIKGAGSPKRAAEGLLAAGLAAIAAGWCWGLVFPIGKNLWTSSYAVFSAGWAAVALSACVWLFDVAGWRRLARPLVVMGTNAIALFVFSGWLAKTLIYLKTTGPDGAIVSWHALVYRTGFAPLASPVNASLLYSLVLLALLYAILWGMYRRGIFLRV